MTYEPTAAIAAGVHTTVLASPAAARVANRMADHVPPTPEYPCIRQTVRGKPMGAVADNRIWEVDIELDVFSTQLGWTEAKAIANDLVGAFDPPAAVMTVVGWTVVFQSVMGVAEVPDEQAGNALVKQLTVYVHAQVERAA